MIQGRRRHLAPGAMANYVTYGKGPASPCHPGTRHAPARRGEAAGQGRRASISAPEQRPSGLLYEWLHRKRAKRTAIVYLSATNLRQHGAGGTRGVPTSQ
eukprot:scaffold19573_cov101-Isochrysis_galbana.AAC.2